MVNFVIVLVFVAIGIFYLVQQGIIPLHRKDNKNRPPALTTWRGLHPAEAKPSEIEYMWINPEGKRMWKFKGEDVELHAEFETDVIEQRDWNLGEGFVVFRMNTNGSVTEWHDPYYNGYFADQEKKMEGQGIDLAEKNFLKSLEEQNVRSMQKIVGDVMAEDYVDNLAIVEKEKARQKNKKKGKKKLEVDEVAEQVETE